MDNADVRQLIIKEFSVEHVDEPRRQRTECHGGIGVIWGVRQKRVPQGRGE